MHLMGRVVVNYISYLLLITVALLFYSLNAYYMGFLGPQTWRLLLWLALAYVVLGLPYYYARGKDYQGSGFKAVLAMLHIIELVKLYLSGEKAYQIPKDQKASLMFLLVKFFYIPLLLNFVFIHQTDFMPYLSLFFRGLPDVSIHALLLNYFFPLIVITIFALDTLWYSFGYLFSFSFLGNRIRSVEPTVLGWGVTLICYPPFNDSFSLFFAWNVGDKILLPQLWLTYTFRVAILLLFLIFLFSTFALGAKCSNLTNRGIVSRGPYRFVRHPAYTSKVIAWWVMTLPFLSLSLVIAALAWTAIYIARAITEERHLSLDPDYKEYSKKVKWRFIPGVL